MVPSILDDVAAYLALHLGAFFGPVLDYLWLLQWYTWGGILLVACVVIGYFAPFAWVRGFLGFVLLLYAAFNAGIQVSWNHLKNEQKKAPPPPPPAPKREWDRW